MALRSPHRAVRRRPPPRLLPLRSAGFVDIHAQDLTAAYLDTARAWTHHLEQAADQLATLECRASGTLLIRGAAGIGKSIGGLHEVEAIVDGDAGTQVVAR